MRKVGIFLFPGNGPISMIIPKMLYPNKYWVNKIYDKKKDIFIHIYTRIYIVLLKKLKKICSTKWKQKLFETMPPPPATWSRQRCLVLNANVECTNENPMNWNGENFNLYKKQRAKWKKWRRIFRVLVKLLYEYQYIYLRTYIYISMCIWITRVFPVNGDFHDWIGLLC